MGDPQPVSNPVIEQPKVVKQVTVPTDLFSMDDSNPPLQQQEPLPVQQKSQTLVQQSSIDILGAYNQNRGSINMVSLILSKKDIIKKNNN
jgi:hypothetical protein